MSRRHEVWLITTDEFRGDIERELPATVHPSFVRSYKTWVTLQRLPLFRGLDWIYYYWWQWKVYRAASRLHAEVGFELTHHVTLGSWRAPSFLCLLPVPFLWGPIGGGETIPTGLRGELGWKGRIFETIRAICQRVSRWDPFVRLTMRRAAAILAVNRDTVRVIPARHRGKVSLLSAIGLSGAEKVERAKIEGSKSGFVVLLAGLLEPRKGGLLAIRAFQRFARTRGDAELVVAGSGTERDRMAAAAQELGVSDRVRFLGGLARSQVLGWMEAADVLLHPSLRDSGGFVLLEAMLAGKPVICLDLGGPGEIVTEKCGIKIPVASSEQVVAGISEALDRLATDPALRQSLGTAGRERVKQHYDWERQGERMLEIYQGIMGQGMTERKSN